MKKNVFIWALILHFHAAVESINSCPPKTNQFSSSVESSKAIFLNHSADWPYS